MENTKIKFLNHASVLISHNEISLLSDPWYENSVFHNGWRLIHETTLNETLQILDYTTHIYISHEHPDHFNTGFFLNEKIKKKIQSRDIKILFQKNYDKRVINFLIKFGFNVIECTSGKKIKLSNQFEIQIVKHDFYDSSVSIKTPEAKILNLNDCPANDIKSLKNFKKKYGKFDLLITQFSYAAWKGGIENIELRKKAANDKLLAIENQVNILECKKVIPFASFVYFSNILNFYMNDSINTPLTLANYFKSKDFELIVMSPNEEQLVKNLKQNEESIKFWINQYEKIKNKNCKIDEYSNSVTVKDLAAAYENYKKRIFSKNSKFLIYILEKIKFLNFFQKINIFIIDKNENYEYSIFSGLKKINNNNQDISLHSQSLLFIFKNEFGFDTLTVNGCFESSLKGFSKISRILAIGSLNAMGLSVSIKIFTKPNIILLFLSKLRNFLNKMKTTTRNSLHT